MWSRVRSRSSIEGRFVDYFFIGASCIFVAVLERKTHTSITSYFFPFLLIALAAADDDAFIDFGFCLLKLVKGTLRLLELSPSPPLRANANTCVQKSENIISS